MTVEDLQLDQKYFILLFIFLRYCTKATFQPLNILMTISVIFSSAFKSILKKYIKVKCQAFSTCFMCFIFSEI